MLTPEKRRQLILKLSKDPEALLKIPSLIRLGINILDDQVEAFGRLIEDKTSAAANHESSAMPIIPLIKPVGNLCNLRCRYCYQFNQPMRKTKLMSDEILEKIIAEVLQNASNNVDFIFHGGEPLLAGIDFFKKAIRFQDKYCTPDQSIRNHIQTNATLIDKELAQFFSDHAFFVGVSLDGPSEVHNRYRVDAQGQGTYLKVMKGIDLLQAAGATLQAISVVQCPPLIAANKLFSFLSQTGLKKWRVNPCREPGSVACYPDYIKTLFKSWAVSPESPRIAIISDTIKGLLGYRPDTCWMNGSCEKFIGFEPDGTATPCCEMSIDPVFDLGNISDSSLPEILKGSKAKTFWDINNQGKAIHCNGCEWTHLCSGGCTYQHIQNSGVPSGKDYMCGTYKTLFRGLSDCLDDMLCKIRSITDP